MLLRLLVPVSYTVIQCQRTRPPQCFEDWPGRLGPGIFESCRDCSPDRAYDSIANVEDFAHAGVTVIDRKNKRNAKKVKGKYRLQDYCKVHGNRLNHLYKNRNDCEVTNSLLKEHLGLLMNTTKDIVRN